MQVTPEGDTLIPQYNLFNFNPYNVYQTPFKRYNAFGQAHYDISDKVTVYGRAMFSKNYTSSIVAPSGIFGEELTIDADNPFLPPAIRDQLCQTQHTFIDGPNGPNTVEVLTPIALGDACNSAKGLQLGVYTYRRAVEVGPRIDEQNTNMFDFKAGLTCNITAQHQLRPLWRLRRVGSPAAPP